MLTHIDIRDFAIIERLELDLAAGMTAITGETGAGKSIMLDAIGLVLGDRAEAAMVRHGARRADISVMLDISSPEVLAWLEQNDLDAGEECVLRRVITTEGRSRCYINGSSTTVGNLRQLGEHLVNIHGQHAHQSLLRPADQRKLLDSHGGLSALTAEVASTHARWRELQHRLDAFRDAAHGRQARLDLLTFQLNELQELDLKPGEFQVIEETLQRLSHADQLRQYALGGYDLLYETDNGSAHATISSVLGDLQAAREIDADFTEPAELLENALIQIEEAAQALRALSDRFEADPQTLAEIESRFNRAQALARKHQTLPESLPELAATMAAEIAELTDPEQSAAALEQELAAAAEAYDSAAAKLGKARRKTAMALEKQITASMQELGMEGGRFGVEITPRGDGERSPHGRESIRFMVSANPGQPLKPLTSVASGGELSRISLAIQLAAVEKMQLPTLIFDEVDSGIGGAVADVVGRQLRRLGERCQVFCVTHLPQVAACAHHHLRVEKIKSGNSTRTQLTPLGKQQRIEEIARMLGGARLTKQSRAHAREMLEAAGNPVA